jgi:hypothetical protein
VFAAIVLAASLAPAAAPAPLPDRWLLKLAPDGLPPLPDRFYAVTWYASHFNWGGGSRWEFWADFRKPARGRPVEALLTLTGEHEFGLGLTGHFWPVYPPTASGHRTALLAVHGPLVEFEGRLYTATIRPGKDAEEMLHLGSAVELKDRVWYQAGTTSAGGKPASVQEWRIEFRDDPRTADRVTAFLRGRWRVPTEPEGESFEAEVRFQAGKTYEGGRTVTLNWPIGMRQIRSLPRLEIAGARGGADVMWVGGIHGGMQLLSLYPAPKPRPQLREPTGLVQPPGK